MSPKTSETIIGDGTGFNVNNPPNHHYLSILRRFTEKRQIIKNPINTIIFTDLKTRIITQDNTSIKKTQKTKHSNQMIKEF